MNLRRPVPMLLVLVLAALPGRGLAQAWTTDTTVRRLDWGTVNVLVSADTVGGVGIWAGTSPLVYGGPAREFIGAFNPEGLPAWLDQANTVASTTSEPSRAAIALRTLPLLGRDSSGLVLIRRRDEYGWDNHVQLVFFAPDTARAWSIRLPLDRTRELLRTILVQALRSRWAPDSLAPPQDNPLTDEGLEKDGDDRPPSLVYRPPLAYPATLRQQGIDGQVWLQFVVRANGTIDPGSFRARLYDDSAFVDAAVHSLARSRWHPGLARGEPIDVVVSQQVIFRAN